MKTLLRCLQFCSSIGVGLILFLIAQAAFGQRLEKSWHIREWSVWQGNGQEVVNATLTLDSSNSRRELSAQEMNVLRVNPNSKLVLNIENQPPIQITGWFAKISEEKNYDIVIQLHPDAAANCYRILFLEKGGDIGFTTNEPPDSSCREVHFVRLEGF